MAIKVTEADLYQIAPGAKPSIVFEIVAHQHLLKQYGIDDPILLSYFFGQVALETQGFTRLEENLYYTTPRRLMQVWPTRFRSESQAKPYTRNPQMLANKVYGGRLGNTGPNDGWLYRGSGCKQTTGKYNFSVVQKTTGLPVVTHPEMLRRFPEALESACIYWKTNNLERFARAGDIKGLTKAVQGGTGGLKDRKIYTDRALSISWGSPASSNPVAGHNADRMLREGDRGAAVIRAQTRLQAHGHDILIDGKFGGGTENIVIEFQQAHDLLPDGVIGKETWKALLAEPKAPPIPRPKPTQQPEAGGWIAALIQIIARLFNADKR